MQFTAAFSALAVFVSAVLAAPAPTHRAVYRGATGEATGRLIVTLKEGATQDTVLGATGIFSTAEGVDSWSIINAFVLESLDDATKETLLAHPDVVEVEEDGIVTTQAVQTDAPWGLGRLTSVDTLENQDAAALTYEYDYEDVAGTGVDVYVVDTGIRVTHEQFGGRASWGANFVSTTNQDGNGHGTHCAGTIGSAAYGVAKNVSLIAVKVLSDAGSGTTAGVISGINFVATQANATGNPSVLSMSLGGGASSTLDAAVEAAVAGGVHVVVAAGNNNADAKNYSPARTPGAITVGASTIADVRASFSNYGALVDIFAPGMNVISTWATSDTATNSISGTSMATPHVAGLVAYLISVEGNVTPAEMTAKIQDKSVKDVLTSIPDGTVNDLAHSA
ncbi:serine protease [Flagelloscypha sp. PMI_526]|nr:serine protease [Flagelloscypha sp. PMI_526]